MEEKKDLRSFTPEGLSKELEGMGEKAFRAKQIFRWLHEKQINDINEMSDISAALRDRLSQEYSLRTPEIAAKYTSESDDTVKYLFDVGDGILIESVLMRYSYGNAVCVSSQAGCRMGCTFCASTANGLERNLSAGEIAEQIYCIQKDTGERVSSVVIMGSGEPLDNFDNVMDFLDIIHSPLGNNLGHRHITLSTCGIADKIYELAEKNLQITLAVSLHAPNDRIRRKLMPIAKKYSIDSVIKSACDYAQSTKRRVTFEYALISGLNDSRENALELASRLKGNLCHVNLIPINDVKEHNYTRSSDETIQSFASVLKSRGIETTIRRRLGSDINASCGQLRLGFRQDGK